MRPTARPAFFLAGTKRSYPRSLFEVFYCLSVLIFWPIFSIGRLLSSASGHRSIIVGA
jgi:hypothetical protein